MRDKELRLALVCYGGISLAVYMHGITREIWHLARASRAYRDGDTCETGSESVYLTLLREIESTAQVRVRVLVDIVAGASAGGMNGVFLSQAIASGQSLEPLTDLWLERADIEALLDPDSAPSSKFTKFWALPLAWMAAGRGTTVEETVETGARSEVRAKLERFVRARWFEPPFGGQRFVHMLLDAFEAMAASEHGPRLLPPEQPLDLFVTVTDFRGHPERLRLNSPPEVVETEHRLVFSFTDHGGSEHRTAELGTGHGLAHPAELTFAVRATSSFPGAFPPFTVRELDAVLADRNIAWPGRERFLEHVLPRQYAANAAESATLIDGSVLANAPFRPAIDALKERPARRQVDRRFVFIDPTPGHRLGVRANAAAEPGFFQTILGALSELPRQQPIRDNLESLALRSERIERLLSIVEKIRGEVEEQVEQLFGYTLFLDYPTPKRLAAWRRRAQIAAANKAGYGHAAYGLLKVDGVIDRIAQHLHVIGEGTGSDHRRQLRDLIAVEVQDRGAADFGTGQPTGASGSTLDFLRNHDLGFRIRRLRLLARRVTDIDSDHAQTELIPMRDAIYESLATYLECQRSDPFAVLREDVRRVDANTVRTLLDRLAAMMNLRELDAATDIRLSDGLSRLSREMRRPILLAHLGFPFFDIATLPLLQGEGLDEFDPIRVDRIAPDDATTIRQGGAAATLKGIQFNSFGAFFSRAYRENDYLWGRLHGADRLVDIILSTLPPNAWREPGRTSAIKRAIFHAILDEEEARLTAIPGLFAELRAEIG